MKRTFEFFDLIHILGKICCVIVLIVILNSILDDFLFRIKYCFPKPKQTTNTVINTKTEPLQRYINPPVTINVKGYDNGKVYTLTEIADYSISGMVVAKNTNFWFRGINRNDFDDIALMDVGLVWGDIADENIVKKNLIFKSKKTLGSSRILYTKLKNIYNLDFGYVMTHSSHTHLIPSTMNVMSALLTVKKYQDVKLTGYLVDITYPNGKTVYTSDTRSDNNASSRGIQTADSAGGGACEIMYVKSVQIGNKIYR